MSDKYEKLIEAINADKVKIVELKTVEQHLDNLKSNRRFLLITILSISLIFGSAAVFLEDGIIFFVLLIIIAAVYYDVYTSIKNEEKLVRKGDPYLEERRKSKQLLNEISEGEI